MKRLPLLLIVLMVLLTACGKADRQGEMMGKQFVQAWGDTAMMHRVVVHFNGLKRDSVRWPWERKAMNRAFAAVLMDDGRDSLFQAAHVIVLSPTELAQLKCPPMMELLRLRQFDTDSAADYVSLIHWLCHTVGYDRHAAVFDSTMQAIVDSYSLREQMNVYVQSSRPVALGAALAADANAPDADMRDIEARIDILRDLYQPADFSTFEAAYQAALNSNRNSND